MKVILDGVFNHCGSFNKWMDREKIYLKEGTYEPGAYISADSPYRDFFKFYNEDRAHGRITETMTAGGVMKRCQS